MTEQEIKIKKETMKKYREEHKEQFKEYQKRYNEKHKKEILEKQKAWRKRNPEKIKEYNQKYWEKKAISQDEMFNFTGGYNDTVYGHFLKPINF